VTTSDELRNAVDSVLAEQRLRGLTREVERLIETYRGTIPTGRPVLRHRADVLAYAAYRMPATFGAVQSVLSRVDALAGGWAPTGHVDIGGGTGAAVWAAAEVWPQQRETLVLDWAAPALELGRELASGAGGVGGAVLREARWERRAIDADLVLPDADLMTLSYVLGELGERDRAAVLAEAQKHGRVVAVLEPGTPAGYRRILEARERFLAAGMSIVAPCPHNDGCPLEQAENDWCHFAARIERSPAHRALKGGTLSHEDEKFAYLVASRTPFPQAEGRVLRHPTISKGMVGLTVCAADGGVHRRVVSKSQGPVYRSARKTDWGDAWPPPAPAAVS
jgi:ribosomal protein RSM22 (predicted rRNA methylase)